MVGVKVINANDVQPQLSRFLFGFEQIAGRDQVSVVSRIFAGVLNASQISDRPAVAVRSTQQETAAFLWVGAPPELAYALE